MSAFIKNKQFTVLSLGAGVQSTTLALMAMHGLIEKPQYAIFANTGWESIETLSHVVAVGKLIDFPIFEVNNGNLFADLVSGLSRITGDYFTSPPFFNATGSIGARHCTTDYKIIPIKRKVRDLLGAGERTRLYGKYVTMQIGISLDECHRAKPSRVDFIKHEHPLLDLRMTRLDCEQWLKRHGYTIPPKSSCLGCPFHSNAEWQRIKSDYSTEFNNIVDVDALLRSRTNPEFMHKSLKPINTVAFKNTFQADMFGNECTGLCGVWGVGCEMKAKPTTTEINLDDYPEFPPPIGSTTPPKKPRNTAKPKAAVIGKTDTPINFDVRIDDFPHTKDNGQKHSSTANLRHLLSGYGIKVSYDEMLKEQKMVFGNEFDNAHADLLESANLANLNSLVDINGMNARIINLLPSIFSSNVVNPILNFIKSKEWDGVDRIIDLADTLTVADNDKSYAYVALKTWLVQCVAAADGARHSGNKNAIAKYELVFILQGGQGARKTSWFQKLLPAELKKYILDGVHLDPSNPTRYDFLMIGRLQV